MADSAWTDFIGSALERCQSVRAPRPYARMQQGIRARGLGNAMSMPLTEQEGAACRAAARRQIGQKALLRLASSLEAAMPFEGPARRYGPAIPDMMSLRILPGNGVRAWA